MLYLVNKKIFPEKKSKKEEVPNLVRIFFILSTYLRFDLEIGMEFNNIEKFQIYLM